MKHTYIIPQTRLINVELQQMIAQSVGFESSYVNPTSGGDSRRNSDLWDDEDE